MEGNVLVMNSNDYMMGFIIGFMSVVIVAAVVFIILKRKRGASEFDERQRLIQGEAYKAAFWVLVAYLTFNGVFQATTGIEWADIMTSSFVGLFISITVFAVICIMKDAYFPINKSPKFYFFLFGTLIILNLATGLFNVFDDKTMFITDGRLNFHILSFIVVLAFAAVFTAMAVKRLMLKKREGGAY